MTELTNAADDPSAAQKKETAGTHVFHVFAGIGIGIANVIPGVSGGTIAVIVGIYDRLIAAITNLLTITKIKKEHVLFLLKVAIGVAAGILAFSFILGYLLERFPMQTTYFFIGLIAGSIPLVIQKATEKTFKPVYLIPFFIGAGTLIALSILSGGAPEAESSGALVTQLTVSNGAFFFVAGIISMAAMIIPGVSGSLILMLMGGYFEVIGSIRACVEMFVTRTFTNLTPLFIALIFGAGCLVAVVFVTKLINFLLRRFHSITYFAILGLIVGSFYDLFRGAGFTLNMTGALSALCAIAGCGIALFFSFFKPKQMNLKADDAG